MKALPLSAPLAMPCVHNNTVAEQRAQIEQLTTSLASATAARTLAEANLATAQTQIATLTGERDTANANLATAQTQIATLTAQVTSVESRANRLLASLGHAPLAMSGDLDDAGNPTTSSTDSPEGAIAAYRAIKDSKARAKFYAENKDKMFPSAKSKSKK